MSEPAAVAAATVVAVDLLRQVTAGSSTVDVFRSHLASMSGATSSPQGTSPQLSADTSMEVG